MLLDIAIYTASIFAESWYGLTLIHREFAEYAKTRVGILKYRELFTKVEIEDGFKYIRIFGKLNSIEDKPAIISVFGTKLWYVNDKYHRENDQPAIIGVTGDKYWFINGKFHRENDEPAVIRANGDNWWYIYDVYRRDIEAFAPPVGIEANGNKHWYINGNRHRENDQPAVICGFGDKYWYVNDIRIIK
jgi:fructose 1,6-bisphosphatase